MAIRKRRHILSTHEPFQNENFEKIWKYKHLGVSIKQIIDDSNFQTFTW